ncbi:MAG: amino acid adenylation domain-containing protein [Gammaproteobacteria bacterium]|nr:amino acid adenylation domain-containing protein [Gammaproteobacteria bacterium]
MINLVQQYFGESRNRHPDKIAVSCGDQSMTFLEVDDTSNAAANKLKSAGLPCKSFVPFFMKKGVNSIVSIMSILKSDCAYVPIDTNSPADRIAAILKASHARLVIVDAESRALFESLLGDTTDLDLFVIDDFDATDCAAPRCENLSIDIAYVLFTSGSTGVPKGVMIPHKAILDYIDWCVEEYALTEDDVIANHAPLYFDNSTFDLYTAFKTGAELHLVDEGVNAVIPRLVKWLRERRVTTFFCVPSVLSMLLRSRRLKDDSFPNLRHVICAGEVLPPDVLRVWMQKYPHIQFTNMYGPTEITVDCSYHVFREPPGADELNVPIGKARNNMELLVRTEDGSLSQTAGASGELLVRGTSVAYGYLGDEERSKSVFIQNPANEHFYDPLYCTGDLVEIRENGDFMFCGRADDQIKFLGHRIELGEIEAALVSVDGVLEGVVVYNEAPNTEDSAIGALLNLDESVSDASLIEALHSKLPPYMVPTVYVRTTENFPQTANGKYDRKAIRALVFQP